MTQPVGETHHLIFYRGTVSWTGTFDLSGINWCEINIILYDFVNGFRRPGDKAIDLWCSNTIGQKREGRRRAIAGLNFKTGPLDRPAIETGRCTRF